MAHRRVGQAEAREIQPLLSDARVETYSDHHVASSDPESETTLPSTHTLSEEESEPIWLAELQSRPWFRRASIFWMIPFLIILGIIIGLTGSPTEQLNILIVCKDSLSRESDLFGTPSVSSYLGSADPAVPDERCGSPEVLALAAIVSSRYSAILGTLSLLTLAKWTSLSDVFGRKALLQLSLLSLLSNLLITWFASSSSNPFGYRLRYLDAVLMGVTAGGSLINPAVFSYVADCTSTKERSITMGYVSMGYAIGRMIGSSLGGYIVKVTDDITSVIKIGVAGYVVLFAFLIVLPESLRRYNTLKTPETTASDLPMNPGSSKGGSFFAVVWESSKQSLLAIFDPLLLFVPGSFPISAKLPSKYTLMLLLLATHLNEEAVFGSLALFIPMTNLVFKWTSYEDGYYYSFTGACSFIVFLGIFPLLQFLYKRYVNKSGQIELPSDSDLTSERNEALLGELDSEERQSTPNSIATDNTSESIKMDMSFSVGGSVLCVIAYLAIPGFLSVPALYAAGAILQLSSISGIATVSLLTAIVPSHQTGKVLGAVTVSNSIASTVATLIFGVIFARTSATVPWFYYYVSAGLSLLSGLILLVVWFSYHTRRS